MLIASTCGHVPGCCTPGFQSLFSAAQHSQLHIVLNQLQPWWRLNNCPSITNTAHTQRETCTLQQSPETLEGSCETGWRKQFSIRILMQWVKSINKWVQNHRGKYIQHFRRRLTTLPHRQMLKLVSNGFTFHSLKQICCFQNRKEINWCTMCTGRLNIIFTIFFTLP